MHTPTGRTFLLAVVLTGSFLAGGGDRASLALLTDSENDPGTFSTASTFALPTTDYLHNNPTPPTGNTNSQANLSMDATAPTAATLRNYDQDRDSSAGLVLDKGGSGVGETDLRKYQNWRTAALTSARTIDGTVTLDFWSAIKDFGLGRRGVVTAFLRDFNPSTSAYTTIGSGTLDVANWQGGSGTWVNKSLTFSVSSYTVAVGRRIELKLIVDNSADDRMWFAYDTTVYPSKLTIP